MLNQLSITTFLALFLQSVSNLSLPGEGGPDSSLDLATDLVLRDNFRWAEDVQKYQPRILKDLADHQQPEILWIGCSDSRVPETEISNGSKLVYMYQLFINTYE